VVPGKDTCKDLVDYFDGHSVPSACMKESKRNMDCLANKFGCSEELSHGPNAEAISPDCSELKETIGNEHKTPCIKTLVDLYTCIGEAWSCFDSSSSSYQSGLSAGRALHEKGTSMTMPTVSMATPTMSEESQWKSAGAVSTFIGVLVIGVLVVATLVAKRRKSRARFEETPLTG